MNYKVVFVPCLDTVEGRVIKFHREFITHEEAEAALAAISNYNLMLRECSLMSDYSSMGMVLKKDNDGNWCEIDDDGFMV